jgi:hypothetical protein
MIISLPVTQTNNAQNQPSTIHPEPDKRTPLLRGGAKQGIAQRIDFFSAPLFDERRQNDKTRIITCPPWMNEAKGIVGGGGPLAMVHVIL